MQSRESVRDRLNCWSQVRKLYRKQGAGMMRRNIPMQCVPKRMHRTIVISLILTLYRSISVMNGWSRSVPDSRNSVKRRWHVIRKNSIYRNMILESLQTPSIWQISLKRRLLSASSLRRYLTGLWERHCVF